MVCPAWSVGTAERRFLRLGVVCPRAFGALLAFGCSVLPRFSGSAGKNRKSPSITRYLATKPSRKRKTGVWSADLGFTPHFWNRRTEVCGKFRNPPSTPPFSRRETAGRGTAASRRAWQVLNLPHTSDFYLRGRPCSLISSAR